LRMHYVEENPPGAPVVLLLHGPGSRACLYCRMIPLLVASGFRIIAPDCMGFGRSDKLSSTDDHITEDRSGELAGCITPFAGPSQH